MALGSLGGQWRTPGIGKMPCRCESAPAKGYTLLAALPTGLFALDDRLGKFECDAEDLGIKVSGLLTYEL